MTRAIVLGAGVLGASVAHRLAAAGADVTVIESGGPAAGTSGATFSVDVTHLKTPHSYYELNRLSSAEHIALGEELDGPAWRHPMPLVQWGNTPDEQHTLRERAERLQSWGHPCRFVDPKELRELAPGADPAACTGDELVVHDHASWYDAPRLVRHLLDRAALQGAVIHYGVHATGLLRIGDRVTGVVAGARSWTADQVVNCTGPHAGSIAELAGVSLPMTLFPGLVGESTPVPEAALGAILAAPGVDLRPAPDDRVLSISWEIDARLPDASEAATARPDLELDLHRRGQAVLAALRSAPRLAGVRVGVRPVPFDGLPLAGALPGAPGLYHLVSHSAVNLAPLLGRLAAEEIMAGGPDTAGAGVLAAYRPDRSTAADVQDESLRTMSNRSAPAAH
ncbi:FAD-dependent oxidoreductase [Streptomyces sp. Pv4-95]|uniref:NAD(P)/FAD-dependent oxidoreductase n=1 Tax=Streptomyces sp. Pv4-95 TaxID=3049543 RepID=UPI00389178C6